MFYRFAHRYFIERPAALMSSKILPHLFFYIIFFIDFYAIFEVEVTTGMIELLKQVIFMTLVSLYMMTWFSKPTLPVSKTRQPLP